MLIIGHRGAADLAPENTLKSVQAALDSGVDQRWLIFYIIVNYESRTYK